MRAIVYDAPRSFTVAELPEPRPAADEVRLRVEMTGVCGTDVHIHKWSGRGRSARTTRWRSHDQAAAVARLRELAPRGFDVVVDATGAAAVSQVTLSLLRDGLPPEDERVSVSPYEIFRRELTIKGSFAQVDCFPRAVKYLRSGRVRTDGIVTHRFGPDDFGSALNAVREDPTALKAVVVPGGA